ncbi:MAG: ATP-binding protein [Legionellaceae bacterium]|nr:ATP-binding protein [Legionellaceae bacterium]
MEISEILLNNCDEFIIVLNQDGLMIEMNPVSETMCETSLSQSTGLNFFIMCKELGVSLSFDLNDVKENAQQKTKFEMHITSTKQHKCTLNAKSIEFLNQKKQTNYLIIGKEVDLPCSKENEKTYLNNIIEQLPQLVYWKDINYKYQGCNKHVSNLLKINSPKDIIGKTDYDFSWSKERINSLLEIDKMIIEKGISNIVEDLIPDNGVTKILLTSKTPLRNNDGDIIGILGISTDITEQKKLLEDLRLAKEAAEAAVNAKTEFIANMSHDIRTPLTGVIGMSEILRDEVENPEHKHDAEMLAESGQQLLIMLNEILEDVRADNLTETDLQEEHFDLYKCISDLVKLESPTTTSKNLGLEYIIEPDVPQFIINDRKKIHHVLLNLLGNAVKFTKKGHITINVKCLDRTETDAHLEFSVADTGIGIPKSLQKKVFERFFRVDPAYKGRYSGYGLGLHIVQTYVSLLGGHVTLTSNENNGTTFHFDLRCQIAKKEDTQTNPLDISVARKTSTTKSTIPSRKIAPLASKNAPMLLLVEDNELALKVLETIVTKAGLRFLSATSGEDAIQITQNNEFELIICDIGLPGISGNEFARQLRIFEKHHNSNPTPVIGLTGHAYDTARPECIASGMNNVFSKPMSSEILKKIADQYIWQKSPQTKEPLGPDLPNTIDELFLLDKFPLFDLEESLKYTLDLPFLVELLNDYWFIEIKQDIFQIEDAYSNHNWPEIERLAHKIKGGALNIGVIRMRYACQYLERYHKAGHRELLDKLYHQLLTVNNETTSTLSAWLSQYAKDNK